jgi:4-amino-4-deoxy-L-arabinose transferase-like glycosyltransferase
MKTYLWIKILLSVLFVLLCVNYFNGITSVPFHPDESTQIYMSADGFDWIRNPISLAYSTSNPVDDRMRYRLIDSPITRTLIGLGLGIRNQNPIRTDWVWSNSWEENKLAGALPPGDVLTTARWSVAFLFPLSCLFLFLAAKKLGGWSTAIISILLFSSNALILIHTRRAMAESALICFLSISVWGLLCIDRRIWASAIPISLAINSKQTSLPLAGVGLLDIILQSGNGLNKSNRLIQASIFSVVILIISLMLNPVFWKSPFNAIQAGLNYRADLSNRMQIDYQNPNNPIEQSAILIGQVFIQPPAVSDVINYRNDTLVQEDGYLGNPLNSLFRGYIFGAIFLGLTIFGWFVFIRRLFNKNDALRYPIAIFLLITILIGIVILCFTPNHFQRYYVALIPLFILSQAIAISSLVTITFERIKKGLPE